MRLLEHDTVTGQAVAKALKALQLLHCHGQAVQEFKTMGRAALHVHEHGLSAELDRFGLRAHDNRLSPTSPPETVTFRVGAPGHIATASVTRHLDANKSHIFQELDAKIHVDEEIP